MSFFNDSNTKDKSKNNRPPITDQHVEEWLAFGPPLFAKPTSPEQLTALQERKAKVSAFKQRVTEELNGGGDVVSKEKKKKWSTRAIVMELENRRRLREEELKPKKEQVAAEKKDDEEEEIPDYQKDNNHPDNICDYRDVGGPLMQYLWDNSSEQEDDIKNTPDHLKTTLQGQTLYLGGEVGSDGNIYCIPGHAARVLQIDTIHNKIRQIGPELLTNIGNASQTANGRLYKWLRGIVVGDIIYGLPCHADEILRIDVKEQRITKLPIPYEEFYSSDSDEATTERQRIWKYHGGAISPIDNCIYAIPQSAQHVLKIDPTTEQISFVGPALTEGRCKWYGGIIGKTDGAIYGIPQNASGVLRITPTSITTHGDFGLHNHKWHGGAAACTPEGVIVSVPANSMEVLCVTPGDPEPKLDLIGCDVVTKGCGRHRDDGKYKYLGAMASNVNGKVYVFPCASEYVLEVDTRTMIAKNVGPNLRDTKMELVYQNKWQNGLTCYPDGCVYGMPLSGHTLLRIDCNPKKDNDSDSDDPIVTTWKLPSPRRECRDKFEGGVITESGVMYTVPNNHKGVLRIEPTHPGLIDCNKQK